MEASGVNRLAPEFWAALAASRPAGDEWRVRPPLPEVTPRLLASLAANGDRRFLIALQADEDALEDTRSRGLSIRTLELADETGARGRFLSVECREAVGHELFDLIGAELATALTTQPPAVAASRVIGKWRRFWGQIPRSLLSREEQLGLFAEVWFLAAGSSQPPTSAPPLPAGAALLVGGTTLSGRAAPSK